MPELPIRLLEEVEFVWMLNDGDDLGGFDRWGSIARAVEREDWQQFSSPDSVKDTIEKGLRDQGPEMGQDVPRRNVFPFTD